MDVESTNWFYNGTGEEARSDVATRESNEGTAGTGSVPQFNRTSETVGRLGVSHKEVSKAVSQSRVSPVGKGQTDVAQRLLDTPATTEARG